MTFFPIFLFVNEDSEQKSNFYLSESAFLVSFTDPNKQYFNIKSVFKFLNHGFSV